MDLEKQLFQIISKGGAAKAKAYEAVDQIAEQNFNEAKNCIQEAKGFLIEAQRAQFELIKEESRGTAIDFSILLGHAMDIAITASSEVEFAQRLINIFELKAQK